jgi:60 kDa SS-A/Ro ribonucleoprotein
MTDALEKIVTRKGFAATPQSVQADPRQAANHAGGWSFTVADEVRIHRFLTIGTTGGTYYVGEDRLTAESASVVLDWARKNPAGLAAMAADVSAAGRAPKNQPAIFAVTAAMALGETVEGRQAAAAQFEKVVRTGTHLFTAAKYTGQFRGWGRGARRAFAGWYLHKDAEKLSYQLVKYRQRDGWTHRDVLRSAHSTAGADAAHAVLFDWLCGRGVSDDSLPKWALAYRKAQEIQHSTGSPVARYVALIEEYPGLPWEILPDEATSKAEVWRALIDAGMPVTALLRHLPQLTRLGVLAPMSSHLRAACAQLTDADALKRQRVHPVAVLIALKTYASGRSEKGTGTWTPVPQVAAALNDAFYLAFGAVEPAGKRTMIALDVSGSMRSCTAGYNLQCAEVTAAMSMVIMKTEPSWGVYGFAAGIKPLNLAPHMALEDVARRVSGLTYGGTDCSLPMQWAAQNRVEVDTFQVWTDNETWAGAVHPHQALEMYRQRMGIAAAQQVIAITPTEFSIADPADPLTLDVSGFDARVPVLLADHARGSI